jgi:hypothetical protein
MTQRPTTHAISLVSDEVRLLIQSLDHCLATCSKKAEGTAGPCDDCERAKALRQRLAKEIGA